MIARFLRVLIFTCGIAAVAWWLFADTIRHHGVGRDQGVLRISFWGDYRPYLMWQEMLTSFREKHPDIPIKEVYITDRYEAKIQQLLVAGSAPDVIVFQDETFPNFVNAGQFEDLTPFLNTSGYEINPNDFYDTAIETFGRYEGEGDDRRWHTYGIPMEGGCNLLFYNKDSFERTGIRVSTLPGPEGLTRNPDGDGWIIDDDRWTIDEFLKVCRLLTMDLDDDGRIDQWGFSLPEGTDWFSFHWSMGARYLDPTRKYTATLGAECEASLGLWQDLRFKHRVSPTPADLGSMAGVAFLTGNLAMSSTGPWSMSGLDSGKINYGILHIPRGKPDGLRATRVTWNTYAMYSRSNLKQDAWKLIHHLLEPECQDIMSRYQRAWPSRLSTVPLFEGYSTVSDVYKFGDATEDYARMQPITPHWGRMTRDGQRAVEGLLHPNPKSRLTPAEAIGMYLSAEEVTAVFPPIDPVEAERYREIYRQRRKGER